MGSRPAPQAIVDAYSSDRDAIRSIARAGRLSLTCAGPLAYAGHPDGDRPVFVSSSTGSRTAAALRGAVRLFEVFAIIVAQMITRWSGQSLRADRG